MGPGGGGMRLGAWKGPGRMSADGTDGTGCLWSMHACVAPAACITALLSWAADAACMAPCWPEACCAHAHARSLPSATCMQVWIGLVDGDRFDHGRQSAP